MNRLTPQVKGASHMPVLTEPTPRVHTSFLAAHIGYRVRPTRRRRGHATVMLGLSLPVARQLGIDPALITCDDTNVASRRVIEANGGSLASASDGILRFWVPTAPRMLWRRLSADGSRSCGRPAPRRRWAAAWPRSRHRCTSRRTPGAR